MFDPYGMYSYDPRFAPNPGPQRPNLRQGYTDQPQGQNGQQAGPGWVFVPRVDDIINVTVQPGCKAWIMAQDQPVFAVRAADQLGVTQTDYYRFEKYCPTAAKTAPGEEYVTREEFARLAAAVAEMSKTEPKKEAKKNEPSV